MSSPVDWGDNSTCLLKWFNAGVPSLWDLMSDDLKWSWCNNTRNKVHNKNNVLKSPLNHLPQCRSTEKLSSKKQVPGARRVGDHWNGWSKLTQVSIQHFHFVWDLTWNKWSFVIGQSPCPPGTSNIMWNRTYRYSKDYISPKIITLWVTKNSEKGERFKPERSRKASQKNMT